MEQMVQYAMGSRLRKLYKYILAFVILVGFSLGIYVAGISSFSFSSLMHSVGFDAVSIVRMLCAVLLPFLISAVAVVLSKPLILYLLLFARAFLRSFCLYGICCTFEQAGWLVSLLQLVTPSIVDWLLTWFSFRHISGFTGTALQELGILTGVSVGICLVDILVFLPVLASY